MSLSVLAHLNFDGQAREALEFYASVFGGKATVTTYGDFGMPPKVPGADRVVFGQVDADNGFRVLAYDVPAHSDDVPPTTGTTRRADGTTLTSQPFFLSVNAETADEAGGVWEKLAVGATVVEPFGPAQWAPAFGMLTDRFGVTWILGA